MSFNLGILFQVHMKTGISIVVISGIDAKFMYGFASSPLPRVR